MHTLTHTYYTIALARRVRINITKQMNTAKFIITDFKLINKLNAKLKWPQPPPRNVWMMHT